MRDTTNVNIKHLKSMLVHVGRVCLVFGSVKGVWLHRQQICNNLNLLIQAFIALILNCVLCAPDSILFCFFFKKTDSDLSLKGHILTEQDSDSNIYKTGPESENFSVPAVPSRSRCRSRSASWSSGELNKVWTFSPQKLVFDLEIGFSLISYLNLYQYTISKEKNSLGSLVCDFRTLFLDPCKNTISVQLYLWCWRCGWWRCPGCSRPGCTRTCPRPPPRQYSVLKYIRTAMSVLLLLLLTGKRLSNTLYCKSKRSWTILFSKLLFRKGQGLNTQFDTYCIHIVQQWHIKS